MSCSRVTFDVKGHRELHLSFLTSIKYKQNINLSAGCKLFLCGADYLFVAAVPAGDTKKLKILVLSISSWLSTVKIGLTSLHHPSVSFVVQQFPPYQHTSTVYGVYTA